MSTSVIAESRTERKAWQDEAGRNAGTRAGCTVEGRANIGKVRGHYKGRGRAGLVGRRDKERDRGQGGLEESQHMADGLAEGWAKGMTGIKTWRREHKTGHSGR